MKTQSKNDDKGQLLSIAAAPDTKGIMKNTFIYSLLLFSLIIVIHDARSQSGPVDYKKLVGNWVRPDGGYTLVIKKVGTDGAIDASYYNPRPIRISEARVRPKADRLKIYIELRDRGYPGSNYTLAYEPDTDRLVGIYHHMVLKEKFDIFFVRK